MNIPKNAKKLFSHTEKMILALLKLKKLEEKPEAIREFLSVTKLDFYLSPFQTDMLCLTKQDNAGNAEEQPATCSG